jgi:hypothetical protein
MNPYAILLLLAVLATSHASAFFLGQRMEAGDNARVELVREQGLHDQAIAYADEIVARQSRIDMLAANLELARTVQKPKDRIITREVIRYEQVVPADRRCLLDGAWRLRHDAAATGDPASLMAEPASLVDGGAEPVEDAAALGVVAENYEQCRGLIDQVAGWQRWHEAVTALPQ